MWLMDADGSNPVQLTHDGGSTATPAWSPDATQIAFASTRLTGSWAIWAIGADGSGLHRVSPGFGVDPTWSPDGSQLAYVSFDALHVMNMDGSGDHMITSGSLPDSAPAWSPDGSRIAFGRYRADWQTSNVKEIWTVRPDGTQEAMLTGFGAYSDHPSWSPDGSRIVFQVSGPAGDSTLVTATPDGRDISVPPNTPPLSFGPSWGSAAPSIELGRLRALLLRPDGRLVRRHAARPDAARHGADRAVHVQRHGDGRGRAARHSQCEIPGGGHDTAERPLPHAVLRQPGVPTRGDSGDRLLLRRWPVRFRGRALQRRPLSRHQHRRATLLRRADARRRRERRELAAAVPGRVAVLVRLPDHAAADLQPGSLRRGCAREVLPRR